jgi:hypothetical protein
LAGSSAAAPSLSDRPRQTSTRLNEMLAEPFPSFTFSPVGASVYQLGSFGTARKELKALRP